MPEYQETLSLEKIIDKSLNEQKEEKLSAIDRLAQLEVNPELDRLKQQCFNLLKTQSYENYIKAAEEARQHIHKPGAEVILRCCFDAMLSFRQAFMQYDFNPILLNDFILNMEKPTSNMDISNGFAILGAWQDACVKAMDQALRKEDKHQVCFILRIMNLSKMPLDIGNHSVQAKNGEIIFLEDLLKKRCAELINIGDFSGAHEIIHYCDQNGANFDDEKALIEKKQKEDFAECTEAMTEASRKFAHLREVL